MSIIIVRGDQGDNKDDKLNSKGKAAIGKAAIGKAAGPNKYEVGDIITLKKEHPCGSRKWEILRVGADFRLQCLGCGHQIMVARKTVEKNTKAIEKPTLFNEEDT